MRHLALVTGGSRGIGRAISLRLARDGYHVLVHYHANAKAAEETLAQILAAGGRAEVIQFDVKNGKATELALESYVKANPEARFDVLINNAGIINDGLLGLMSDEAFDSVVKTNLYGPFYLMRWVVRRMMKARAGSIVNISSLAGQSGKGGQANYAASKAGLIAMTRVLSHEVGSRGIRVNAVAPGFIETEMISHLPFLDEVKKFIPLSRIGRPEEIAGAVSFLCSPDAAYITGHTLSVNGGMYNS